MASVECNKSFSSDYVLLKPEEASLLELTKILISSDVGKRTFVDCPDGVREEPFRHRWIICVSVLGQKFLRAVSKPLAGLGGAVEHWLNLLSGNGGFFGLLKNSLKGASCPTFHYSFSQLIHHTVQELKIKVGFNRFFLAGKVIQPDKTSSNFLSFLGNLDNRLDLDSKIGCGDLRYNAALSVMASKVSYENENVIKTVVQNHWKMDFLRFYNFPNDYEEKATTQAFALQDENDIIIVSFRGTEPFESDDWSSDFDISWYELPGAGKIHGGFMKALGLQKSLGWPKEQPPNNRETAYYGLRKLLKQRLLNNEKAKFLVTGHSLGGALAVLFPAILALHEESFLLERLEGVYTFGQPRVGDEKFEEFMKKNIEKYNINYLRFVYSYDLVPRLPSDDSTFMFKHFGTCIYYNSFYKAKIVTEEPDKNYFSILWLIPKIVNALWELIRSFTIPYTKGPEYKETGLLRIFRVIGLFAAGVPAHCLQDYVNATRLGSSDVFLPKDQKIVKVE